MINWNTIEWGSERQWNKAIEYLSQVVTYNVWFWILVTACVIVAIIIMHDYHKHRNLKKVLDHKELLFLYVYFLLYTSLLNRTPSASSEFFLWSQPIIEDGVIHESRFLEHVISILLFLPFGLLPFKLKRLTELCSKVLCAFIVILFIEIVQLLTARGVCNIADIVDALIGATMGHIIIKMTRIKDRRIR